MPVKLSAAERILNALGRVEHKRGEDFLARQHKEAAAMRPILDDLHREGVIEGLEIALTVVRASGASGLGIAWSIQELVAEIERARGR